MKKVICFFVSIVLALPGAVRAEVVQNISVDNTTWSSVKNFLNSSYEYGIKTPVMWSTQNPYKVALSAALAGVGYKLYQTYYATKQLSVSVPSKKPIIGMRVAQSVSREHALILGNSQPLQPAQSGALVPMMSTHVAEKNMQSIKVLSELMHGMQPGQHVELVLDKNIVHFLMQKAPKEFVMHRYGNGVVSIQNSGGEYVVLDFNDKTQSKIPVIIGREAERQRIGNSAQRKKSSRALLQQQSPLKALQEAYALFDGLWLLCEDGRGIAELGGLLKDTAHRIADNVWLVSRDKRLSEHIRAIKHIDSLRSILQASTVHVAVGAIREILKSINIAV